MVWNGLKLVFEVSTARGKSVPAPANPPLLTLDGWMKLSDLVPAKRIAGARRLAVASRATWPRHELVALAGLLAEGNTCHPTSLHFYGNDRAAIEDFAAAISCFPDTVARIYVRPNGGMEICANLGRPEVVREQ